MSGYTMSQGEVLWASSQAGTNDTYAAGTEQSLMGGLTPCVIPAFYFLNNTSTGRTLKLRASGLITCVSAVTWTWNVRLFNGTNTFTAGGGIGLGPTPALTAPSSATLAPWFLDLDIVMRNVNPGATSVICAQGEVRSSLGLASPFMGPMPGANTTPQNSVFDNSATWYLHVTLLSSSASASNLANLQMAKLYGEN
jgi:hypothetical protein